VIRTGSALAMVLLMTLGRMSDAAAQPASPASMDSLLQHLVGDWNLVGQVRGNTVEYRMDAKRTLGNRYVELHMIDVVDPPAYEARVFLGVDKDSRRYIVHWLDSFGAAYSIPHGIGTASGDTIRFEFKYADGPFRDEFAFNRRTNEWRFHLESGDSTGAWQPFADYRVKRH